MIKILKLLDTFQNKVMRTYNNNNNNIVNNRIIFQLHLNEYKTVL